MTQALQFGAVLLGFLTAVVGTIPAVIQYRAQKKGIPESQRQSRKAFDRITRPWSILIGGIVLSVISGLLLVQLTQTDEEPHTTAESLLHQLADDDARECEIVQVEIEGAIAGLECAVDEPMKRVTISLFGSTADIENVERDSLALLGSKETGDCTTQRVGWQEWEHGKLFCDYSDPVAGARIEWSRHDSNTWLEAEALPEVSADRVYDWWNYDDNGAPANNRLPYPDRYERYIVDTAGMKPSECTRTGGYKDSVAAVVCDRPRFDTLFFGYYTNSKRLHEALGLKPGKGSCLSTYRYNPSQRKWVSRREEPGRRAYVLRGDIAGTRDCYEDEENREVIVEWTNQETGLFGFAKWSDSNDLEDLFSWWEMKGRFLTD